MPFINECFPGVVMSILSGKQRIEIGNDWEKQIKGNTIKEK